MSMAIVPNTVKTEGENNVKEVVLVIVDFLFFIFYYVIYCLLSEGANTILDIPYCC